MSDPFRTRAICYNSVYRNSSLCWSLGHSTPSFFMANHFGRCGDDWWPAKFHEKISPKIPLVPPMIQSKMSDPLLGHVLWISKPWHKHPAFFTTSLGIISLLSKHCGQASLRENQPKMLDVSGLYTNHICFWGVLFPSLQKGAFKKSGEMHLAR